jgi:hypothetical protein
MQVRWMAALSAGGLLLIGPAGDPAWAQAPPPFDYFSVSPCRLLDTRQAGQGPALASGASRLVTVTGGSCGIPVTARAIVVNITSVASTGAGNLKLYAGDGTAPTTSALNFAAGQTRANNGVFPLAGNGDGTLAILATVTGNGTVHVVLDVTGYFAAPPCDPDGTYTKSGAPIAYSCCLGLVNLTVSTFTFQANGALITTAGPSGPQLVGVPTTCPSGAFNNTAVLPGGCTETYNLAGSFSGPNDWAGTYSLQFTGSQCSCFGGLGTPCINQSFPVAATR